MSGHFREIKTIKFKGKQTPGILRENKSEHLRENKIQNLNLNENRSQEIQGKKEARMSIIF